MTHQAHPFPAPRPSGFPGRSPRGFRPGNTPSPVSSNKPALRIIRSKRGCPSNASPTSSAHKLFRLFGVTLFCFLLIGKSSQAGSPVDFNRQIRPILSDNCFQCHGPDGAHRKADLRLDLEEHAKSDTRKERVIVPGEPGRSAMIGRITTENPEDRMPPPDSGKELSPEEISLLKGWIAEGAPWSRHWAYISPRRHPLPSVRNTEWPLTPIDFFILAQLETRKLTPSPPADPATLLRRLSFDLTGLPPSPEEAAAFLGDTSADAYERQVDRLLGSSAYGERMAMYWLDLVRFADTVGYHGDQDHSVSPYRDWVIHAFNQNMPFDRFTAEQLAGDLIPGSGIDQKVASAYNRLLQTSHEGGVQLKEYLAMYAADRVRNLSSVWMGATMGCSQCHDHKFDPYTSRDFYSMAAFFADLDEADHLTGGADNSLPTQRNPEITVLPPSYRARAAALESRITALETEGTAGSSGDLATAQLSDRIQNARTELEALRKTARRIMISAAVEPRVTRILPRGNWLDETGPVVEPAVPTFLGSLDVKDRRANRLDLARWLTDPLEGTGRLTARVFANRFWHLVFGAGIAGDLDDFGGQGEPPTHPELHDALALDFVESGWDIKLLMKRLVMSRTYRQSSQVSEELSREDPYNQWLARQSRFRLPAEFIRDNALAVSGLLVRETGGASVRPYQPEGYYRHLNFPPRTYTADTGTQQWRRGLYMHWQRQFLHPMLKAFDAPRREECTAQRPQSNTPLAALVLLNDPTFVEAARVFAEKIVTQPGTDPSRIEFAFRRAVSRAPDALESRTLGGFLSSTRNRFQHDREAAVKLIRTGTAPVRGDLDPVELAAWTEVARALLNLSETITRY